MTKTKGLTVVEFMVVMTIITFLLGIGIPGYSRWLPGHKLKNAAKELYSSMQLAKMAAIRNNGSAAVVFTEGPDSYQVVEYGPDNAAGGGDDVVLKTITLANYGSGVKYGMGGAGNGPDGSSDAVNYPAPKQVVFNGRGMADQEGFVCLDNKDNVRSYGVGTLTSGVILFRAWDWDNNQWE